MWRVVSWHKVRILSPTYIIYRNSEIRNSDSDFLTRNQYLFSDGFPTEICGIPVSEGEIPIPDPPARGAVPAEFPTKLAVLDAKSLFFENNDYKIVSVADFNTWLEW